MAKERSKSMEILRRHFEPSFAMLVSLIDACPDETWASIGGGFPFWQQIVHSLTGLRFWLRESMEPFSEPDLGQGTVPDLGITPAFAASKEQVKRFAEETEELVRKYFELLDDAKLQVSSTIYPKCTYMDIILMQIRHIQYHVGHCDAILRQNGACAAEWQEYGM